MTTKVTAGVIAANAVNSAQIISGSIDTAHIASGQVTTAKIADSNITTAKINDDAVTSAKLDTNIDIAGTFDVTGATTLDSTLATGGRITVTSSDDYLAKFESTDAFAGIVLEDNNSTNNGNVIAAVGDTMRFYTGGTSSSDIALTLGSANSATVSGNLIVDGNTTLGNANTDTVTVPGPLAVDTDTLYVDVTNDKVGINVGTSPSNALSVSGVITSGNFTSVGVGGTPGDANTAELGPGYLNLARDDTADAKQILFGKNGSVHSYIETTTGTASNNLNIGGANVGIGTTSPDALLHLNDSGNTQLRLTTTQDSNTPTAQMAYSAGSGYFLRLGDAANNEDVMIRTYGNTVFNGGNVGIGTSSPASILHIEGNTNEWGTAPMLYFGSTSTANAGVRDWAIGPADTGYGNFHFNVGASTGANPVAANNEVMVLTSAKKVGIKTTSPAYDLDVNGTFAFRSTGYAYDATLYAYDSGNSTYLGFGTTTGGRGSITMQGAQDLLLQTNAGNVGIGTTDATELLHLSATAPEIKMANSSMNYHIRSYNNNFNIVPQNATYGLSMSSNGEVCVGNSTDTSALRRARRFNVEGNGTNKDGVHVMNYNGANTYQCAYHTMTAASSTIYIHIETSISTQSNIMFRAHFTGYNYGTSSVIDMHGVGYAYQPQNAVISGQAVNNGGDTNQALGYYTSNNNRVVLRLKVGASSSYYCGFVLHMEFAQPTGYNHEFTVVNASWTSSSANQY